MINQLAKDIHDINVSNGFYEEAKNIGEMLALIHSEVSEVLECDRNDQYANLNPNAIDRIKSAPDNYYMEVFEGEVKDTFEDELADIIIRVLDLAAYKQINIDEHIRLKMKYNSLRPYKHGKKY